MKQTMTLRLDELMYKMRHMKEGEEIGLCVTAEGDYRYGIRCLPGRMFDNGMCWIADYYGGGSTEAFSETEEEFQTSPELLEDFVYTWLAEHDLLSDEDTVFVEPKDWTRPETRWEFKETVIPPKNKLARVNFRVVCSGRTDISVPGLSSDADIVRAVKWALMNCDKETFDKSVVITGQICAEDFVDITVDHDFREPTDLPTGTLGK